MIDKVQEVLGYRFQNAELLKESLTHASLADHRLQSNERLEFLGDSVLGYVVCEYLFRQYPELHEGDMTKIKSAVVSRRACAKVSRAIGLDDFLNLGKGMSGRPSLPSSVAAAAVESVIAAIYLDGGIEPAKAFILEHMVPLIEAAAESAHHQNYKSALQQHAQQTSPHHPVYILLDEKGPDHAKCFEVCVEINGRRYPSAWANAKKEAEQRAAYNAMVELGEFSEIDDEDDAAARERRAVAEIEHAVDETAPG
jgi:ribonuclease III